MNRQQFRNYSADSERENATTSSASTKDGIRVRSLMKDTESTHTHTQMPLNTAMYTPTRQGKQIATILVIGVVLLAAALLYALRSNGVSSLLGGKDPSVPAPSLSENPAMVTEGVPDAAITPQPVTADTALQHIASAAPLPNSAAQPQALSGDPLSAPAGAPAAAPQPLPASASGEASQNQGPAAATGQTQQGVATAPAADEFNAQADAVQAQPATDSRPAEAVAAPKPVSVKPVDASAATPAAYSVQVCATADKAEAERVARQLRNQRIAHVAVEDINRDGRLVYRVRFGAFGSNEAARQAAERAGQDGAWIVRKNSPDPASPKKTTPVQKKDDPRQKQPLVKKTMVSARTTPPVLPMAIARAGHTTTPPKALAPARATGAATAPGIVKKSPATRTAVTTAVKKNSPSATAPRIISPKGIVKNVSKREIAVATSAVNSHAAPKPVKKPDAGKVPVHQAH